MCVFVCVRARGESRHYMDKFLVTITQYAMSNELHGCYREAMLKLTHDQSPCYIAKGTHTHAS
jgi:hypothetical protein